MSLRFALYKKKNLVTRLSHSEQKVTEKRARRSRILLEPRPRWPAARLPSHNLKVHVAIGLLLLQGRAPAALDKPRGAAARVSHRGPHTQAVGGTRAFSHETEIYGRIS